MNASREDQPAASDIESGGVGTKTGMWQPIETCPRDGREVLLAAKPPNHLWWKYGVGGYTAWKHAAILFDWNYAFPPTHWMPLPPPPNSK